MVQELCYLPFTMSTTHFDPGFHNHQTVVSARPQSMPIHILTPLQLTLILVVAL